MKFLVYLYLLTFSLYAEVVITVQYFEDTTNRKTVQDISQHCLPEFKELTSTNFGITNATFWLKISISNTSDTPIEKVFELEDGRIDSVEIFDDAIRLTHVIGDMYPFNNRVYNDPHIAINISANAHTIQTYFLKVENSGSMDLKYVIWDKKDYLSHLNIKNSFTAFYFGAILIMLLYNFILYLFIRERAFLEYVLYHLALLGSMLYYNGILAQVLFPLTSNLNAGTVPIQLASLATFLATQFARSYLKTARLTPKIDKILLLFMSLNALTFLLAFFPSLYHLNHYLSDSVMVLQSVYLLFASFYHIVHLKSKIAQFYFLGWFFMMIGIILTGLVSMGLVIRNELTGNMFQLGSIIEVTLLSMGLAYRYKMKQNELIQRDKIIERQNKLATMGEMIGHISHQWRQPLSEINAVIMKIEADLINEKCNKTSLNNDLIHIEDVTDYMSRTIENFNTYLKTDKQSTDTTLENIVSKALSLSDSMIKTNSINMIITVNDRSQIKVYEGELIQVFLVILNNAKDALVSRHIKEKEIRISIDKHTIEIEDNAGGIDNELLSKVFEPYFTTKPTSNGIGIGLYMSKMLIEESMHGTLSVNNTETGAKFTITL